MAAFGIVGAAVGLVVGLVGYPPTAWFAAIEIGFPAALLGFAAGLVGGGVASLFGGGFWKRDDPLIDGSRWPDTFAAIAITCGATIVLSALQWLDWATRVDQTGRTTFTGGPVHLLVGSALASGVLALAVAITHWRWLRVSLLVAALVNGGAVVAVALSRTAASNTAFGNEMSTVTTSYGPGAPISLLVAFAMVGLATLGLLLSRAPTGARLLDPSAPPSPTFR